MKDKETLMHVIRLISNVEETLNNMNQNDRLNKFIVFFDF